MLFLYEIHFWTTNDDVYISNNDFGTFKYFEKKEITRPLSFEKKKSYAQDRQYVWTLSNKKPPKLKHLIRELEAHLKSHRIVRIKWLKEDTVLLFLNSGIIVYILINLSSGDIANIGFDKYLKEKLVSPHVCDVLMTNVFSVCCYNDPQLTLIHYSKPAFKKIYKKLSDLEPKFSSVNLPSPNGRRLPRNLCANKTGDVIAIWWKYSENDVFPWSPLVKDIDRSNVHVYSVTGSKLEILCYYRTEHDLLCMAFSSLESNILFAVEQKISREGDISIESSTFEIVKCSRLQKSNVVSIPLRSNVCSVEFSPDRRNLLLGCIDGTLILYNQTRALTHVVQTVFVPSLVRWHADGHIVAVASDRGEIQCFDFALSCIKMQALSEDITPSNITDLSVYFAHRSQTEPPVLAEMQWNVVNSGNETANDSLVEDSFLLLTFNTGPLVILRFFGAAVLTSEFLVTQYLNDNHIDKAINILLAVDWDTNSFTCSAILKIITNHIFTSSSSPTEKYSQIQTAVESFYAPVRPMCHAVETEFYKSVRNISRRLFHYVLRHNLSDYAFSIAKQLNEHDLFMDLYYYAKSVNNVTLLAAAEEKAQRIIVEESTANLRSDSEDCDCSCSECSSENSDHCNAGDQIIVQQLPTPRVNYTSPTMHMSYASVTRVNPPQQTAQSKLEKKVEPPNMREVSTDFRRATNIFSPNNGAKMTSEVCTGLGNTELLNESGVQPKTENINASPSSVKSLSPASNTNLYKNIPSDIAQGLLEQAGLSESKMRESKSIKVVHFGVV